MSNPEAAKFFGRRKRKTRRRCPTCGKTTAYWLKTWLEGVICYSCRYEIGF